MEDLDAMLEELEVYLVITILTNNLSRFSRLLFSGKSEEVRNIKGKNSNWYCSVAKPTDKKTSSNSSNSKCAPSRWYFMFAQFPVRDETEIASGTRNH